MTRKTILFAAVAAIVFPFAGGSSAQGHNHASHVNSETDTAPKTEGTIYSAPHEFNAQLDSLFAASFAIQGALSRDAHADAVKGAARLRTALGAVDMNLLNGAAHERWMEHARTLNSATGVLSTAKNIAAARIAFRDLSNALIPVLEEFGSLEGRTIYVLHCPMAFNNAGADWLQSHPKVENPYFGKSMFACGKVTETHGRGKETK